MFAGAAREAVFSNPAVVRRINDAFIPVALKAALVNNPPRGIEGELYAEIARSKPAPQGICSINSDGKVLTWALSFDDDASIVKFLDHVVDRYQEYPEAQNLVTAERFMKFPSRKMPDVRDTGKLLSFPEHHSHPDRCPAKPALDKGTLVGRIIGRPLGTDGEPIRDTFRQEEYMEARFEVEVADQRELARAAGMAGGERFQIPDDFARSLITHAYLGQLDVNPLSGRNERRHWKFYGKEVAAPNAETMRVRIVGASDLEGGQGGNRDRRNDGRMWEHRVTLKWQGYVDIEGDGVTQLYVLASGDERLRWGNANLRLTAEADVEHLMAGHPIDFTGPVRYGLHAQPCALDEVVD